MERLTDLIESGEGRLVKKILDYAISRDYVRFSSTREEDWRLSIAGLSSAILELIKTTEEIPELGPDDEYVDDPLCQFGIIEAQKHRLIGITLQMFLGLFKYYKQSYHDLVNEQYYDQPTKDQYNLYLERCFDRMEIGFCTEWTRLSDAHLLDELQTENRKLTNLKNKFHAMVESIFDPAILVDSENKISYANSKGLELLKDIGNDSESGDDLITGNKLDILSIAISNSLERFIREDRKYGADEVILERQDGNHIYQILFSQLVDVSHKYSGIILVLRDVTNEIESSLALEDSQRQQKAAHHLLQKVMDNIPMAVFWKDKNSVYLGCNKVFALDSGVMDPKKIRGKKDYDLDWPREIADLHIADDKKVMTSGIAKINFEEPFGKATDSPQGWLRTSKIPLMEEDGSVYGVLGLYEDITDSKNAGEFLRKSESQLREAEKIARVGHWELNATADELYLSDEIYRLLQIDISDSHLNFNKFLGFYGENSQQLQEKMESTISGKPAWIEIPFVDREGKKHWHFININTDKNFDGSVLKLFGTIQDITKRKKIEEKLRANEQELKAANDELQLTIEKLGKWNTEIENMNKMSELLQACRHPDEAYSILAMTMENTFSGWSGEIHTFDDSKSVLTRKISWGLPISFSDSFDDYDCWALRLGKGYQVHPESNTPICNHIDSNKCYLGVPIVSLGENVGVLHIAINETTNPKQKELMDEYTDSINRILEQFGITLSNLQLREELRTQSVQDPLTKLYNRRYMEQTLSREEHRILRHKDSLAIIMIDLDHFKDFNDKYGHQEGDRVLEKLGQILIHNIRGEDVACRYGGEEFVLLLPGSNIESAEKRAENIRQNIETNLVVDVRHEKTGMTASLGVAVFPEEYRSITDALKAADDALYKSKKDGRNRVTIAKS